MRPSSFKVAAVAAALALTAGCGKKAPRDIPPAPAGSEAEATPESDSGTGPGTGAVGTTAVPGSRAHFIQNVQSDRIHFDTDSYAIDDEDRAILDSQVAFLQANPSVRVTIEGHCDERGTREYNLALGDRRANAARDYLQSRGIAASRMQTISWGKERPEALGSDESAWAQNRRAVTVLPN